VRVRFNERLADSADHAGDDVGARVAAAVSALTGVRVGGQLAVDVDVTHVRFVLIVAVM
jgi:hypothetical protein